MCGRLLHNEAQQITKSKEAAYGDIGFRMQGAGFFDGANKNLFHANPVGHLHIAFTVACKNGCLKIYVREIFPGLKGHPGVRFAAGVVFFCQGGAIINLIDPAPANPDLAEHLLMDHAKVFVGHQVFADPLLVGQDDNGTKHFRELVERFLYIGHKLKLPPVTDIAAFYLLVDHPIAVEEKGPAFIDLFWIEAHIVPV